MSLDQRQSQIEVDKGLTESRLNQDFVDFLRKYGTAILLGVCAISVAYVGWDRYSRHREGTLDEAWLSLEKAIEARSPEGLIAVAEEHASEAGLPLLARVEAADILVQSAIMGVVPGAEIAGDGTVTKPDDLLTPEGVARHFDRAADQYEKVIASTSGKPALVLHQLRAMFGMAAVDESRSKFDDAKRRYEQIVDVANTAQLSTLAGAAKKLLDTIEDAKTAPRLYSDAQVVTKPAPPPPPPAAANPATNVPGLQGLPPGSLTPVNPADLPAHLRNPGTTNVNPNPAPTPAKPEGDKPTGEKPSAPATPAPAQPEAPKPAAPPAEAPTTPPKP